MGEPLADALHGLGASVAGLRASDLPATVVDRLRLVLLDHLGVTVAGATTPEGRRLVAAASPPPGPAPVVGAGRTTTVDLAAWLNGTAVCSLELDEGNKYARGHPAAHAFPAALALAAAGDADGTDLVAALVAGYEVAARFGAATRLRPGIHPHGNWGVTGAAAAVCRLLGLDGPTTAAALDAACGLVLATPFAAATTGNPVRNAWTGAANVSGLAAARLAAAGLATVGTTAADTLGGILGELDVAALTEGLGEGPDRRWLIAGGYFKRHASCSFTHPPADAVLELRRSEPDLAPADVVEVVVETHGPAAALDGVELDTRLGAMFSTPYVVAVALSHGDVTPSRFDDRHRSDPALRRLAAAVRVRRAEDLHARLPAERPARVTLRVAGHDGRVRELTHEVPNPVGDADHHPFGLPEVRVKLSRLLEPSGPTVGALEDVVERATAPGGVGAVLVGLP